MTYNVIVSDPSWGFSDSLKKMKKPVRRSAQSQYNTLSVSEIAALPVADVADPRGCVLALWVPGSMLVDGLFVMSAWGFKQKQLFVWAKIKKGRKPDEDLNECTRVGMGRLFRQSHEVALIGTSGKSPYPFLKNHSQRSVAFDLNLGHSSKPETLQDRLDIMFPGVEKLELFARRYRPGWTCLGNALDGADIRDSLPLLVPAKHSMFEEQTTSSLEQVAFLM